MKMNQKICSAKWRPFVQGEMELTSPLIHQMVRCLTTRSCKIYRPWAFTHWPPEKFEWNFRHVIFKQILLIDGWGISSEVALLWMSLDFINDQSTLVQVVAWCHQATSHYLSQCWPRSLSPYDITRPQWVKLSSPFQIWHVYLQQCFLSNFRMKQSLVPNLNALRLDDIW